MTSNPSARRGRRRGGGHGPERRWRPQVAALLQREGAGDAALWAHKRAQQQADMKNARAGRVSQEQLSWFSGNKAKRVKLSDTPY